MQIKNIRHTGIVVDNLRKSLNFYKKLMGFKIKKRMIEKGIATDRLSRLKNTKVETVKMYIGKKNFWFTITKNDREGGNLERRYKSCFGKILKSFKEVKKATLMGVEKLTKS